MDFWNMLYQDWAGIVRTVIVGTLGYAFLIFALRISGNRTLSKLNAFDFVVSVAFGSVFASLLLSEGVALAEGATAIALLCALQYIVAWGSVRSRSFARLVRSEPVLLANKGEPLPGNMHRARITREELESIVRNDGHEDVSQTLAVVLESDGTFSIVTDPKKSGGAKEQV